MSAMTGWKPHLVCLAVLALEVGAALLAHRSPAELERVWREGSASERLDALHVLANRGRPDPTRFDNAFIEALLREPDDRLKEAAFVIDLCKFRVPEVQNAYLAVIGTDYPHWWRAYVIHRRKVGGFRVGGGSGLRRIELAWYLDALRELPPPLEEVDAHLRRIADRSRRRQTTLGIDVPHRLPGER